LNSSSDFHETWQNIAPVEASPLPHTSNFYIPS